MRIAVIGSGIAGMGCAWLLNETYEITLYEADDRLGGHAHTMSMPTKDGPLPVDTGFLVYNEPNYPNLTALFDHLDVATKKSSMSFGVSLDDGRFEYSGGESYASLFAQKRNLFKPGFYRLLGEILRFNREGKRFLEDKQSDATLSLGDFLDMHRFSQPFCDHYLLPMSAAIWSASLTRMRAFPALSFLRFFDNHGLISINQRPTWHTVDGGSKVYVEKLTASYRDKVRLGLAVRQVVRHDDHVALHDGKGGVNRFDAVVLACHADHALAMIDAPTGLEREILGSFDYQDNQVFLHSDRKLMPKRQAAWSSWNYLASRVEPGDAHVSVTYWLNHLQSLPPEHLALVSLNPVREPAPESVVAELRYAHPLFDAKALRAQTRLHEIQGRNRLWFAGAHWGYGFHEDGLLSGLRVAAGLGVTAPWWSNIAPLMPTPAEEIEAGAPPVRVASGG